MKIVIGIDEVGRGPLAGPVVVACVALPSSFLLTTKNYKLKTSLKTPCPLRDSKKLTEKQRTAWYAWIKKQPSIKYTSARCTPRTIDIINITKAANCAAERAYQKLLTLLPLKTNNYKLKTLLDAGLRLPKHITQKSIIKGDEKIPAIALASILAKVARDAYMERMHKRYPHYSFNKNKGYGTATHIKTLKRHGPCPLHRLTFIRKILNPNI